MSAAPNQAQVALDTVLKTAEVAAPTIAAVGVGVAAATNPDVALALQIGDAALPLLSQAQAMANAGSATPAQLQALWASVSSMVLSAHATLVDAQPAAVVPPAPASKAAAEPAPEPAQASNGAPPAPAAATGSVS